jgi:hypothetical protein
MDEQYYWNIKCGNAQDESIAINSAFFKLKPRLFIDGDMWCALYGENLQDGVAGFGETPDLAAKDFDKNWMNQKPIKQIGGE